MDKKIANVDLLRTSGIGLPTHPTFGVATTAAQFYMNSLGLDPLVDWLSIHGIVACAQVNSCVLSSTSSHFAKNTTRSQQITASESIRG
jgi:hypothetical protein